MPVLPRSGRCGPGWYFAALLFLLGGCASLGVPHPAVPVDRAALSSFLLEGRFSLRQGSENHSGRLSWQHRDESDELLLSSPFGQGVARITRDAHGARLTTSEQKSYAAADVETLTRQVLGYPLPLARLVGWARGQAPVAGALETDAQGRPVRFREAGWDIEYSYAEDAPQAPPRLIVAERAGELGLRLRIDEWHPLPSASAPP